MKNLRHQNKGQAPLLSPELQEAFYQALRKPHPRDGLWNIGNAAEWLSQRLGRPAGLELDAPPGPTTPPPAGRPRGAGSFQRKLFLMVFWLKLLFRWRYGLLLSTGWGSSPSADGYGPRWPRSGPAIAGCRCMPS
jgi:hypothetical protein